MKRRLRGTGHNKHHTAQSHKSSLMLSEKISVIGLGKKKRSTHGWRPRRWQQTGHLGQAIDERRSSGDGEGPRERVTWPRAGPRRLYWCWRPHHVPRASGINQSMRRGASARDSCREQLTPAAAPVNMNRRAPGARSPDLLCAPTPPRRHDREWTVPQNTARLSTRIWNSKIFQNMKPSRRKQLYINHTLPHLFY